jgi:hypothetical protein
MSYVYEIHTELNFYGDGAFRNCTLFPFEHKKLNLSPRCAQNDRAESGFEVAIEFGPGYRYVTPNASFQNRRSNSARKRIRTLSALKNPPLRHLTERSPNDANVCSSATPETNPNFNNFVSLMLLSDILIYLIECNNGITTKLSL